MEISKSVIESGSLEQGLNSEVDIWGGGDILPTEGAPLQTEYTGWVIIIYHTLYGKEVSECRNIIPSGWM